MKLFFKHTLLFLFAILVAVSCESSFDSLIEERLEENPPPDPISGNAGDTDFSNFVTIGNSTTAGFMDGALYNLGQENSLGALLAGRLAFAGAPQTFNQPDINSELGFNTSVPNPDPGTDVILGRFKLDTDIPGPSPTLGGDLITAYGGETSSLDNFAVPGIVVGQLLIPETGGPDSDLNPAFNPFYERFASSPGTSTIIGDIIATQPSFFTLWIGTNDVLGYAASGASNPAILTSNGDFDFNFNTVVDQLMANTPADGVVVNIPPFLGLAFFQAIPYDAIPLDAATAEALNAGYAEYNGGLQTAVQLGMLSQDEADRRTISFGEGNNAFVINDETLTDLSALGLPNLRQSEPTDLSVLTLGSVLGQDLGNGAFGLEDAVTDEFVLLPSEQEEIEISRATFNATIQAAVNNYPERLALYDTNTPPSAFLDIFGLSDGVPGITVNSTDLQPDFSPNGVLSTDGVHPNARGNAIIANEIIRVIEQNFGATLPEVDVLNLPSVQLCDGNCASEQGKELSQNIRSKIQQRINLN